MRGSEERQWEYAEFGELVFSNHDVQIWLFKYHKTIYVGEVAAEIERF